MLRNMEQLQNYNPTNDEMTHEELKWVFDHIVRLSDIHGRFKLCSTCNNPMVTLRALHFLGTIESGRKDVFSYDFWIRIQKEVENGLLLNDEQSLYHDLHKYNI